MSSTLGKVRGRLVRALGGQPPAPPSSPAPTRQAPPPGKRALREVRELRARVAELEEGLQESRQLNKRLAELTDVLAEVLLPAEHRDEERLRTLLEGYDRTL